MDLVVYLALVVVAAVIVAAFINREMRRAEDDGYATGVAPPSTVTYSDDAPAVTDAPSDEAGAAGGDGGGARQL